MGRTDGECGSVTSNTPKDPDVSERGQPPVSRGSGVDYLPRSETYRTIVADPPWPYEGEVKGTRHPKLWDVGFHELTPRDWQDESDGRDCDVVSTGRCFYDGSSLQGEELGRRFMAEGEDVVWAELEDRYRGWLLGEDDE